MKLKDFVRIIRASKKNNFVYHFTDEANIPSIREYGLLSKLEQETRNISAEFPGGDIQSRVSDKLNGIHDDVSLCLWMNNPMAYKCRSDGRHPNQVLLYIDPDVLRIPGTRVCLGMANTFNAKILPISEALDEIDTDILYSSDWATDFKNRISKAEKIEVLIPKCIPVELIKRKSKK